MLRDAWDPPCVFSPVTSRELQSLLSSPSKPILTAGLRNMCQCV